MENDFNPVLVDKETFIHHYKDKGLMEIINGLSWVAECFGIFDQLKKNPVNSRLKNRLIHHVIPELKKEPVGEKAFNRLNEIEIYIKENDSLDSLEERLDILLLELSNGYRVLLQQFVSR